MWLISYRRLLFNRSSSAVMGPPTWPCRFLLVIEETEGASLICFITFHETTRLHSLELLNFQNFCSLLNFLTLYVVVVTECIWFRYYLLVLLAFYSRLWSITPMSHRFTGCITGFWGNAYHQSSSCSQASLRVFWSLSLLWECLKWSIIDPTLPHLYSCFEFITIWL